MTRQRAGPGVTRVVGTTVSLTLPADWSPEQAFAVFEILDELRERVWACYGTQIQQVLRDEQGDTASPTPARDNDDAPF